MCNFMSKKHNTLDEIVNPQKIERTQIDTEEIKNLNKSVKEVRSTNENVLTVITRSPDGLICKLY